MCQEWYLFLALNAIVTMRHANYVGLNSVKSEFRTVPWDTH